MQVSIAVVHSHIARGSTGFTVDSVGGKGWASILISVCMCVSVYLLRHHVCKLCLFEFWPLARPEAHLAASCGHVQRTT